MRRHVPGLVELLVPALVWLFEKLVYVGFAAWIAWRVLREGGP